MSETHQVEERETREEKTREKRERKKVWMPPERLPQFEASIPGYHLRWVRYSLLGADDDANVLSRVRQGYEPVEPYEVNMKDVLTMEDGKYAGTVVSGDLMLMKVPVEIKDQRNKYFADRTKNMQKMVDQELAEKDNDLMPLSKSVQSQTTTGRPQFKE